MANSIDPNKRQQILNELLLGEMTQIQIAVKYEVGEKTVRRIKKKYIKDVHPAVKKIEKKIEKEVSSDKCSITTKSLDIRTVDEALEQSDIDLIVWEVDRSKVNSWEVTMNTESGPQTYTNYQVSVWLKKKKNQVQAIETLLQKIGKNSPICPKIPYSEIEDGKERQLEVNIMDPHLGLHCYTPQSDLTWSLEECEQTVMAMLDKLLENSQKFGPFEKIIFPLGNDFLHADNVFGTTTAGTHQPECDSWHEVFCRGQELAIAMIEKMKEIAPVKVIVVPGNHDRQTSFVMGKLISAYYRNDENIEVDDSASPYKFHHYGVNLIGLEHGHSVKPIIRLGTLMANECRDVWAQTVYREWHVGDQHRKGSSKPNTLEEQGVSIEYLPGLTPPNEWHRLKSYNWQKRAAMSFVWDKHAGPIARLQVNIDSYTGKIMK